MSFPFIETQPHTTASSSAIIHTLVSISVVPLHSPPSTTGIHFTPAQGAVNTGVNMAVPAVPAFLMNRYAPLNFLQPLHDMPQEYLKLLPRFTGEDEITAEQHLPLFCTLQRI